MRRHKAFPRPGDRIRLAVPLPTDQAGPHARYGTVLERSCGRSNALRVRWDRDEIKADYGVDAGLETWLADAAWYWDKSQLAVVGDRADDKPAAPVASPRRAPASDDDAWLTASPRAGTGAGVDGSLDAVAEWEAALASEIDGAADGSWEQLLASALGNGASVASVAPAPRTPSPPQPQRRDVPATPVAPVVEETQRVVDPEPIAAPVKAWTGDDILPRRAGGRRWGRR